ncbi:MAG: serine hydrolase [Ruminococcaceae bacterium]|nr:serine hydrolase [Oscillospiraceae bacterium]
MENTELKTLEKIKNEIQSLSGQLGFYYKNLESGFEYGIRENDAFLAASVIKFPLFMHILKQCEEGKMCLCDKLLVENQEKVPSCGALNLFTDSIEADILTLCKLMICISDNTATNRLIRHCTLNGIEKGFFNLGLEKTKIRRRLFDSEASARGIENTICPKEMGVLLEKLYKGEFINNEKSKLVIDVLKKQQINHKMGGKLKEVCIAHKTGEDYMLSNDVGIVYAKSPFVICFAGYDTDVYKWEDFIRNATYELCMAQCNL